MKPLYLLGVIYIGLAITSCSTLSNEQPIDKTTSCKTIAKSHKTKRQPKNPLTVSFYPKGINPKKPFTIIGTETVSKYNMVGIKRQEGVIRDYMSQIAAAMGGDAVINITHNNKIVSGTVVSYEKQNQAKAPQRVDDVSNKFRGGDTAA